MLIIYNFSKKDISSSFLVDKFENFLKNLSDLLVILEINILIILKIYPFQCFFKKIKNFKLIKLILFFKLNYFILFIYYNKFIYQN